MMRHIPMTPAGSGKASSCSAAQEASYGRVETKAILTAMENRVLALVTLARTNKEIACALNISPATVKRHIENLLRKLKLRNRVEAAIYGLSMAGCCAANNGDCPLVAWRKRHATGKYGPIGV